MSSFGDGLVSMMKAKVGILGDKTDFTTRYRMSGNTKCGVVGSSFELKSKAYVYQIKAKILNEFRYHFRYAIYELVDGYDTAVLVGSTVASNVGVFGEIVTLALSPAGVILDPLKYLLSVLCEGSVDVYGGARSGHDEYHDVGDSWADGFHDPFGGGGIHNTNFSRTIYAEYVRV